MGGGGAGGSSGGLLQSLMKPLMTGRGDPLGLMPEQAPASPFLQQMQLKPPMPVPQDTDRTAFLRAFGVQ
jgi:hypothetical protein